MHFIMTPSWDAGIEDLSTRLNDELSKNKKVLWLVSGGSNIHASVQIMSNIPEVHSQNLSVMLIDERYGAVGHTDSNWDQLIEAGFGSKSATLLPVLIDGLTFEQTVSSYDQMAQKAFTDNEVILAQCGIGDDGHIAGILPESPATHSGDKWVAGDDSSPYSRLTLTFKSIKLITAAYTFAYGASKLMALKDLRDKELDLDIQPAQILKLLPVSYVYTDQLGDN